MENGASFQISSGQTITLTGTPAFSSQYIKVHRNSLAIVYGLTFSGSATGTRYTVATGGFIETDGGGTSYFPGNAAGTGTNYGTSPYGMYNFLLKRDLDPASNDNAPMWLAQAA